jgi:Tfp pilus assembly protein PilZ
MHTPPRQRARIVPPDPITVAIDDENGLPLAYGVIANVSESGACVWTDGRLEPGARLVLRISFPRPPEVHEVAARVVWGDEGEDRSGARMQRYGVQWHEVTSACVQRLRDLALQAPGERRTGAYRTLKPAPRLAAS